MAKSIVAELLDGSGIAINGKEPWDVQIHNDDFYQRVINETDLGLAESYMEGWWDCQRIDMLITKVIEAKIEHKIKNNMWLTSKLLMTKFLNFQTKQESLKVGVQHYDVGNSLFKVMLDSNMNYTCGYWKDAQNLEEAQQAKLDLTCRKLMLEPGMRVLDIGCGWGSLAKYAAEKYGVSVVGITISKEQCELAKMLCRGLPIEIRFQDYRELNEQFDRVVSLGMFEHVGHMNYRKYMQIVHNCLKSDGLFLLHTIGGKVSSTHTMPWISKYIFPNGMLPSIAQIGKASERLLIMEDWHNFGVDYYKTLMAWHHNFNQGWDKIKSGYNEVFFRMWNYYLQYCAAGFQAINTQLWQIVFSKDGLREHYYVPR